MRPFSLQGHNPGSNRGPRKPGVYMKMTDNSYLTMATMWCVLRRMASNGVAETSSEDLVHVDAVIQVKVTKGIADIVVEVTAVIEIEVTVEDNAIVAGVITAETVAYVTGLHCTLA